MASHTVAEHAWHASKVKRQQNIVAIEQANPGRSMHQETVKQEMSYTNWVAGGAPISFMWERLNVGFVTG